ncbi:MAG: hypothetical protein KAS93_01330 [Gammaproteobacteria bacterium]|nr:hypothetical protein [Gammaproteobacteria bacterium]
MNNYIVNRLRCDARHALDLAQHERVIEHTVVKGRFREIIVENLLRPWLPPFVGFGTGIITDSNVEEKLGQDDIILYDKDIMPPILQSSYCPDGVFPYNGVLLRIEVKSILENSELKKFAESSKRIAKRMYFNVSKKMNNLLNPRKTLLGAQPSDLLVAGSENAQDPKYKLETPYNILFAYSSQIASAPKNEIAKITKEYKVDHGIIPVLCVADKALWKVGAEGLWEEFRPKMSEVDQEDLEKRLAVDRLVWFVGLISTAVTRLHRQRLGLEPDMGVFAGIGYYLPDDVWVSV